MDLSSGRDLGSEKALCFLGISFPNSIAILSLFYHDS